MNIFGGGAKKEPVRRRKRMTKLERERQQVDLAKLRREEEHWDWLKERKPAVYRKKMDEQIGLEEPHRPTTVWGDAAAAASAVLGPLLMQTLQPPGVRSEIVEGAQPSPPSPSRQLEAPARAPTQEEVPMSPESKKAIEQLDGKTPEDAATAIVAVAAARLPMIGTLIFPQVADLVARLASSTDDQLSAIFAQTVEQHPEYRGLIAWLVQTERQKWTLEVIHAVRRKAGPGAAVGADKENAGL